ncbi:hypothetical protein BGW36DRAFT_212562 [Talaromyces proteolyticus]|uniref:Zn(2)-C6 fungal-type domain-containing protein n=1 Tax=Talaromyces proteolyticus TaxID=1131652 RepID=A0AAD4KJK0_9EURO|nr:uncharacterized protein BGW36DRAFT_212562 [Talaromyces proteolyticus]KAH8693915.1 hypothetical protein BGW36DRAFT_212562 [Talaromyces proteolyticus]
MVEAAMLHQRLSLVCDNCKLRKVRCSKPQPPETACINCRKRGYICVFSPLRRKFKHPVSGSQLKNGTDNPSVDRPDQAVVSSSSTRDSSPVLSPPSSVENATISLLYVDQLLHTRQSTGRTQNSSWLLGANENYLATSSMSFFSETRLKTLSNLIGNNAVEVLIKYISDMVKSRLDGLHRSLGPSSIWKRYEERPRVSTEKARLFIQVYFEQVHPLHPFLDRVEFEHRAFNPDHRHDIISNTSWEALYYTVLALGCKFQGGGSFDPGCGEAWKLFRVALELFPRIMLLNTGLAEVQALTAMAIFSLNLSCLQIQGKVIAEAARAAQRAGLSKTTTSVDADARSRAFWVVYYIEKTVSFNHGTTSLILDCDIGSPIPSIPEAIFKGFDWFLASIRIARLYSLTFTELFSISATTNSVPTYLSKITKIEQLLENQRQAIPIEFRPGEKLQIDVLQNYCEVIAALRIHYHYHELRIALCRLRVHIIGDQSSPQSFASRDMMESARAVIELTRTIYIEPFIPLHILVFMPLSALFVLFDLIIHNPTHKETQGNLALLESAAGYFSSLEYATKGSFPSSMLAKFAYISRSFVDNSIIGGQNDDGVGFQEPTLSHPDSLPNPEISDSPNPLERTETEFFEPLSFPMDMGGSVDNMIFPGLEVRDLFGAPVPDFHLIFR